MGRSVLAASGPLRVALSPPFLGRAGFMITTIPPAGAPLFYLTGSTTHDTALAVLMGLDADPLADPVTVGDLSATYETSRYSLFTEMTYTWTLGPPRSVPEPASASLALIGLAAAAFGRRQQRT